MNLPVRAACLGLLLLCPAGALPAPETPRRVEESFQRDPGPLDFVHGEGFEQFLLQSLAGDALTGLRADGSVAPRLAKGWKATPDGLAFELRGDARFADGKTVSAEDAAWTFTQIQQDPKASLTKRAVLEGVRVSVERGRLRLRSPRPAARLLAELARLPIAEKGRPDSGSGPFALRTERGEWFLERRPHFLNPQLPGFHFRLIPDAEGVLQALRKGWLDLGAPPPRAELQPPPALRALVQPTHSQVIVWSRAPLGALQALERWRRDAFPPRLLGARFSPSRGLWPETLGFAPMAIQAPPEAPPAELELIYAAGDADLEPLLLALSARARRDGVELRLKPLEAGLLMDRIGRGEFQLACALNLFDPEPWSALGYVEPKGDLNFTGWSDPGLAALESKLDKAQSPAWTEAEALWARHPAALPILDGRSLIWIDKRLKVEPSAQGLYLSSPGAAGWSWGP